MIINNCQYDTHLNWRSFITQWVIPALENNDAIAQVSDIPVNCGHKFCLYIIKTLKLQRENKPL